MSYDWDPLSWRDGFVLLAALVAAGWVFYLLVCFYTWVQS